MYNFRTISEKYVPWMSTFSNNDITTAAYSLRKNDSQYDKQKNIQQKLQKKSLVFELAENELLKPSILNIGSNSNFSIQYYTLLKLKGDENNENYQLRVA